MEERRFLSSRQNRCYLLYQIIVGIDYLKTNLKVLRTNRVYQQVVFSANNIVLIL